MANAAEKTVRRDWSDWFNPVFIKEMRQYFHNRAILAVMGVLLLVQLLLLVMIQLLSAEEEANEIFGSGAFMFGMVTAGMALAAFLVNAVGSMLRFTEERRDRELDFSRTTMLSANRIILGKLSGAFVMTVFIYALCLPFIVIAYFLRGIAMPTMLVTVLATLPPLLIAMQAGILVGCAGKRWLIGIYFLLMFLLGIDALVLFGFLVSSLSFSDSHYWLSVLLWYTLCFFPFGLLYALSVAALSSRQANRMLPVRIFLAVTLGAALLAGLAVAWMSDGRIDPLPGALFAFEAGGAFVAAICATLAAFERLDPGRRVRRSWPRNRAGRFVYFLFSSGAWGGIGLSWLIVLAMGAVSALLFVISSDGGRNGTAALCWCAVACYFLFYAQIGISASSFWTTQPGWCFWMFTVILFVFLPLFLCGLVARVTDVSVEFLLITTPFCLVDVSPGNELLMALFGPSFALASLVLAVTFRAILRKRGRAAR